MTMSQALALGVTQIAGRAADPGLEVVLTVAAVLEVEATRTVALAATQAQGLVVTLTVAVMMTLDPAARKRRSSQRTPSWQLWPR